MRSLLLTFDYELFLGARSGTVERCILQPTDLVLDLLKTHAVKHAIFFVDTVYLWKLKEREEQVCKVDFEKIKKQLVQIVQEGHYVYPHLHPHWIDAVYLKEINQWDLSNSSKYSFSNISESERTMIFSKSMEILSEITGSQKEIGYRAGGWCIQPFQNFAPYFEKYNIYYEFSVLPGYNSASSIINFNFKDSPNKKYYRFRNDVNKEEPGPYTEFPISMLTMSGPVRVMNRFFMRLVSRKTSDNFGDGYSNTNMGLKTSNRGTMASFELLTSVNIHAAVNAFNKRGHLHFISHPKMLSLHNIRCMDLFLKKILKKGYVETNYLNLIER